MIKTDRLVAGTRGYPNLIEQQRHQQHRHQQQWQQRPQQQQWLTGTPCWMSANSSKAERLDALGQSSSTAVYDSGFVSVSVNSFREPLLKSSTASGKTGIVPLSAFVCRQ
eukprot:scpid75297/ scgid28573/ 